MFTDFMLENTWFTAMDSPREHPFNFNEAISLVICCETQEEIDYYWEKLSAEPEAEQCRLGQRQIRRLVADRPCGTGRDDDSGYAGANVEIASHRRSCR